MRVAVLNGPNLNLLGVREPALYGRQTLAEIEAMVRAEAASLGVEVEWSQSNHEGVLVDAVQALRGRVDGAVVNPAGPMPTMRMRLPVAARGTGWRRLSGFQRVSSE